MGRGERRFPPFRAAGGLAAFGTTILTSCAALDTGSPSAVDDRRVCVLRDGGSARCVSACASDEVCFTQTVCSPVRDGGSSCMAHAGNQDDHCHRQCARGVCPDGESCERIEFFACTDYNGAGSGGRAICVRR